MKTASASRTSHPGVTLLRFEGPIDERVDVSVLTGTETPAVIDLEGVDRVTSYGVRTWVSALRGFQAPYYCFVHCHPSVVWQFNMVSGFGQRGEVVSLYAPYVCKVCDRLTQRLYDLRHEYELIETLKLPPVPCSHCGGKTVFDDLEDTYFEYVRSRPRPRPPTAVNVVLDGRAAQPAERRFELKKAVEADVTALWLFGTVDRSAYFKRVAEGLDGNVVVIMAGVDAVSQDGWSGLAGMISSMSQEVHVARVPGALVGGAAALTGRASPNARIVSIELPLECTQCHAPGSLELTAAQIAAMEGAPAPAPCTACGEPTEIVLPDRGSQAIARARALPLAPMPYAVHMYLLTCREYGETHDIAPPVAPGSRDLLLGKYQVIRKIGQGGMGDVLLARQTGPGSFEKQVVIKRIRADKQHRPETFEMFVREARLTARLSHPNLVQVFDFGGADDDYIMAMEYVNGIDLATALEVSRRVDLQWPVLLCCKIISNLCAGLHAAHANVDDLGRPVPIVHRDVSPGNVLLSIDGAVKLGDFGVAKSADDLSLTAPNIFIGKVAYGAPEQIVVSDIPLGPYVDIYAAGVILYEMITLQSFQPVANTLREVFKQSLRYPPPDLRARRPEVPAALEAIQLKAVQRKPQDRYLSAQAFSQDLERILHQGRYVTSEDLGNWVRKLLDLQRELSDETTRPM